MRQANISTSIIKAALRQSKFQNTARGFNPHIKSEQSLAVLWQLKSGCCQFNFHLKQLKNISEPPQATRPLNSGFCVSILRSRPCYKQFCDNYCRRVMSSRSSAVPLRIGFAADCGITRQYHCGPNSNQASETNTSDNKIARTMASRLISLACDLRMRYPDSAKAHAEIGVFYYVNFLLLLF